MSTPHTRTGPDRTARAHLEPVPDPPADPGPVRSAPVGSALDPEAALLGLLLNRPALVESVPVRPDHYRDPLNAVIHQGIAAAVGEHGSDTSLVQVMATLRARTDVPNLMRRLRNGTLLTDLMAAAPLTGDTTWYAAPVLAEWRARQVRALATRLADYDGTNGAVLERTYVDLTALLDGDDLTGPGAGRKLTVSSASGVRIQPVRWVWADRIPAGALTMVPGREGIGKSLLLAWLCAQVTRGALPGIFHGHPRAVIYAASEDSWSHTIAPRLLAAGADLDLVFQVQVTTPTGPTGLVLPVDTNALASEVRRLRVGLVAADPLLSLISSGINTHHDRDLRTALEPIAAMADATGAAVVGLAHFNKAAGTDSLDRMTGSRAFSAVARAVLSVGRDPDNGDGVLTQAKNNLGRLDLPNLAYTIETVHIDTDDGPAPVGRLRFTGETTRSVNDLLADTTTPEDRADRDHAADWITDYLTANGGHAAWSDVRAAAKADGIAERTLQRARARAGITADRSGYPARTVWRLPTTDHEP